MKLKHGDIKKSANYGFWKRMKASTASVWEKAKRKTTYALAGAVVVAALSAAPGCDKHPGTDPQQDATVQQDSTVQRDSMPDSQVDAQVPDAAPPCPDPVPETLAWNQNLIGDYMNRRVGDRESNSSPADPDQAYPIGGPDTDPDANPFTDGIGGNIGPSEEFMYRVDSADATAFADVVLTDDNASLTYTEQQALWIHGSNHFDTDPDDVVGQVNFIAYSLKFDDGTGMGIPVCTTMDATGDYNSCLVAGADYNDATVSHRLTVSFLGEQWLLIGLVAPGDTNVTTGQEVRNGGSVRLAKEQMGGVLNLQEWLAVDNIKFQLFSVEEQGGVRRARIAILDEFNNIIGMNMVTPGQTVEFNIAGDTYRLYVFMVSPASAFPNDWADMSLLSREMELVDGQELDLNNATNPGYDVVLGWKNRNASMGSGRPDSLRTMIIYSHDIQDLSSSADNVLEAGDYISIAQDPETWRLGYQGLDITSGNVETLRFEMRTTDRTISSSDGPFVGGEQAECTITAPYVDVSSTSSGAVFSSERSDATGQLADDGFYVVLNAGGTCTSTQGSLSLVPGTVLMKLSPSSSNYGLSDSGFVGYEGIGDGTPDFVSPNGGMIAIDFGQEGGPVTQLLESAGADCTAQCIDPNDMTGSKPNMMFAISEYAGAGYVDYHVFGAALTGTGNAADATFDFDSYDGGTFQLTSADQEILYGHATANCTDYYGGPLSSGPVSSGMELIEEGHISERGSTFMTMSNNTVDFEMSHTLGKATWTLGWAQ